MKLTNKLSALTLVTVLFSGLAAQADAAVFVKLGDIKGESGAATQPANLKPNTETQSVGLLLPAVQSAREAARSQSTTPSRVGTGTQTTGLLLPAVQPAREAARR